MSGLRSRYGAKTLIMVEGTQGRAAPMESFFSRYKNPLVLIAILLVQTLLLATQVQRPVSLSQPDQPRVRLLRLWTLAIFSPVERFTTWTGHSIRWTWKNYIDLRNVRQENDELRRELARHRLNDASLAEDALEAQRLRTLLSFKQHYVTSTVVAEVIGTSGSDASRVLTLNKGARDGLKPDMAVITPDGVVGKLRDVFPDTSQLLLLSDATSGAGVVLEPTRIRAIVRGTPLGRIQISNLTADARIKPGDHVVTSGGDQVYPRGLPVGIIESIVPDPEHQPYTAITLKPAANLSQLEEVLVITATGGALDAATQAELAEDAAQHAADISASRLPSVHDGDPQPAKPGDPAAAVAPPTTQSTPIPKPKPAAHDDRYSPGTVPPADELTPGAAKLPPAPNPASPPK
jgi:rod shape-determining protein MreC